MSRLVVGPIALPDDLRLDLDPTTLTTGEQIARTALSPDIECVELRVSPTEHQLRARYRIGDATPIVVIAGPPETIAAHRTELDEILRSARFDDDGPACLADFLG